MANYTPNYNLKKPLGSENYNVADQNGNMDTIDTALNGIDNGLAIVSTGNTHGAITTGQYVYVRRHNTLAEGLYKANSNIAANATLTSSNLSSVSGGLGADVASLNDNITIKYISASNLDQVKSELLSAILIGKSRVIQIYSLFTGDGFEQHHSYYGTLVSESSPYFSVNLVDNWGKHLDIGYINGTWTFNNINNKMFSGELIFDGTGFPAPTGFVPKGSGQLTISVRNSRDGSLYLLWYNAAVTRFEIATTLSGNAPQNGDHVWVQYFTE